MPMPAAGVADPAMRKQQNVRIKESHLQALYRIAGERQLVSGRRVFLQALFDEALEEFIARHSEKGSA